MKKLSTTVTKNSKIKTVSVWLDELTVKALEQLNDKEFTKQYILDEHDVKLADYRETRRHTSLYALDKEIPDKSSTEDDVMTGIEVDRLKDALKTLTDEQSELIKRVYYDGESQTDMAAEMGIDKTSVRDRLRVIYKKIQTFLDEQTPQAPFSCLLSEGSINKETKLCK